VTKQSETGRGSSYELYGRVSQTLIGMLGEQVSNIKQVINLTWLVVVMIESQSITLSQLANRLPGETEAESRVTRIREWLKNPKVEVWMLYQVVLRQVLADWQTASHRTLSVIVDGTLVFGDRLQIFRLSLAHGNRAIPLTWTVVPGMGLVQVERLRAMFVQVAEFLRTYHPDARILLLADRGFRDHDWALLCQELGWGYRIRIVRNIHIRLRTGTTVRLDALKPKIGRTLCLSHTILTQQHAFATHVSMTWTRGEDKAAPDLVIVISDDRAHPERLREYAVRMDIEQSFRDDKSGGFDIDHTRLVHPDRLERLLLAVAIATLWCHEVGQFVVHAGEVMRRLIDPAYTRHLSVFQLGLRWIQRCLAVHLDALPTFMALLTPLTLPPVTLPKT